MKYLTFLIYTLAWQSLVWGGCWYAVMEREHSAWWILMAIWFSSAQWKPERWSRIGE